jgi:MerR family transcriptional regulator, heat shock protein HspR
VYTVGQVAAMLQVTQAFLRRLDELAVVRPDRSSGGQRRYSRRQIATVARVRDLAGGRPAPPAHGQAPRS